MSMARNRGAGFSLVEILVAVAVAALVVPAILSVVPHSFSALAETRRIAAEAEALAAFDCAFDADFASLVPESGFAGGADACSFWTMREVAPGVFAPAQVEYRIGARGVVRRETPLALYVEAAGTNRLAALPLPQADFPPTRRPAAETFAVALGGFKYGAGKTRAEPEASDWSNPTNAPASVGAWMGMRGRPPLERLWFRRAAP